MDAKRKAAHRGNGRHEATTRVRVASDLNSTTRSPTCQPRPMAVVCASSLAVCERLRLFTVRNALLALCVRWGRRG